MKRTILTIACAISVCSAFAADTFNRIPSNWKWVADKQVAFSCDANFSDATTFVLDAHKLKRRTGLAFPEKYVSTPEVPGGAVNPTFSPDSTMLAFTRNNDLYIREIASGKEARITYDGTDLILNGYASWVYYEEIFGRPSRYRAFWWSPDSRKIAFYRFDNTMVPLFPIYSAKGQDGSLNNTRYPKAGEKNPEVRIGMVDVQQAFADRAETVWADFDPSEDQYFGTPFWGRDSREFFVSRMPRTQNTLDLYSVSPVDGSRKHIYNEHYDTWIEWISGMVFTSDGLYMARAFETGWQQIYFLSYDGRTFRRITDGPNWDMEILKVDEASGTVFYSAKRDNSLHCTIYRADSKGVITALTDPQYNAVNTRFSPDGKYFVTSYSNARTPSRVSLFDATGKKGEYVVADMKGEGFNASDYCLPQIVYISNGNGQKLPGSITFPKSLEQATGLDAAQLAEEAMKYGSGALAGKESVKVPDSVLGKYPVVVNVYGGPDTPVIRDSWKSAAEGGDWFSRNDIITISVDPRSAGHFGRAGEDDAYKHVTVCEMKDYICWAQWLQSLPYVRQEKIGVTGFSFGGTTTVMLLCQASQYFHYGIAGGGVYDWKLYDTHYTERFMDTPANNPDGYAVACALNFIKDYPVTYDNCDGSVMLRLTHGTGDDNVHFQNTIQLVDELQKYGKKFELMIYPDGMHGYRGYQGEHSNAADRDFWTRFLLEK